MSSAAARRRALRVALDHNFPVPIVEALRSALTEELVAIKSIHPRMALLEDHDVVRAVAKRGFDILVSCDRDMMAVPRVLGAVLQTKLTVVVADGQGHDHVAASGLVLAHLPHIAAQFVADEAQVFVLRTGRYPPKDPWELLEQVARRQKTAANALYDSVRLSKSELARDPLDEG